MIFVILGLALTTARAQCVDSSEVKGYKIRSVKLETLFGRVPKELRQILDSHRSEIYTFDTATKYFEEINKYYANDAAQEKYERLIARKLRLSVKAGTTWLKCVKKVAPTECQSLFAGVSQCVDVTVRRYFVDVDAVDSSPYLLLFPRSALATFYGAMPRPLLALNPGIDARHDQRFGPVASIDTTTDLLDLKGIFAPKLSVAPAPAPQTVQPSPESSTEEVTIDILPAARVIATAKEPPSDPLERDARLLLRFKGAKSLTRSFYDTSAGVTYSRIRAGRLFQELAVEATFDARHVPQGSGDYFSNAGTMGFFTNLHPKKSVIKIVNIGGKYRWSRNRFFSGDPSLLPELNTENGFAGRMIIDGSLGGGLLRAATWLDGGTLDNSFGSYRRVAAMFGYGKEITIHRKKVYHAISPPDLEASLKPCWTSYPDPKNTNSTQKNEQTFTVEVNAGAGHTWGAVPEYARFYAGRPPGQFLYDELTAQSMTAFPSGPSIRTLPQSKGGIRPVTGTVMSGGTSFWHTNLSVGIPVSAWSRPLIPHAWVTASKVGSNVKEDAETKNHVPDGVFICRDLKSTIKTLVNTSGVNLLINQEARDQLTDAEKNDLRLRNKENRTPKEQGRLDAAEQSLRNAKIRVRPVVEQLFEHEVTPITDFIADHANIIAVKPLLVFDVAHLAPPDHRDSVTRYGLGGGLQIDVVLARFELGYITALKSATGDPRGQFFGRLVLKRFF